MGVTNIILTLRILSFYLAGSNAIEIERPFETVLSELLLVESPHIFGFVDEGHPRSSGVAFDEDACGPCRGHVKLPEACILGIHKVIKGLDVLLYDIVGVWLREELPIS